MNLHINFHQIDPTDAIKKVVERKSNKLEKFFHNAIDTEWFLEAKKDGHHARAVLSSQGYHINADATTEDLYKAIDDVIHKMETQIKKQKAKVKVHPNNKPEYFGEFL